jgi:hypothetical protein
MKNNGQIVLVLAAILASIAGVFIVASSRSSQMVSNGLNNMRMQLAVTSVFQTAAVMVRNAYLQRNSCGAPVTTITPPAPIISPAVVLCLPAAPNNQFTLAQESGQGAQGQAQIFQMTADSQNKSIVLYPLAMAQPSYTFFRWFHLLTFPRIQFGLPSAIAQTSFMNSVAPLPAVNPAFAAGAVFQPTTNADAAEGYFDCNSGTNICIPIEMCLNNLLKTWTCGKVTVDSNWVTQVIGFPQ